MNSASVNKNAVFGVTMPLAAEDMPSEDGIPLPIVFRECIDQVEERGLRFEGIYRINALRSKVDALKETYNRLELPDLGQYEPHVAASLLKQYLRDLPSGLISPRMVKNFEEAIALENKHRRRVTLRHLLYQIHKTNRVALAWLSVHFNHVLDNTKYNKVTREQLVTTMSVPLRMSPKLLHYFLNDCSKLFPGTALTRYVRPEIQGDTLATQESSKGGEGMQGDTDAAALHRSSLSDAKRALSKKQPIQRAAGGEYSWRCEYYDPFSRESEESEEEKSVADDAEKSESREEKEIVDVAEKLRVFVEREYITEEQRRADPELRQAIYEEKALRIQQGELLAQCDELKKKCEVERDEIAALRQKCKKEQARLAMRASNPNGDIATLEGMSVAELQYALRELMEANEEAENDLWEMIDRIHEQREACTDIRVRMKMMDKPIFDEIKPPSLAETRALPGFEDMF